MNTTTLTRGVEVDPKPLGIVRIECSYPVLTLALKEILKGEAEIFEGRTSQGTAGPSAAILHHDGQDVASEVRRLRNRVPGVPVVVFALSIDPRLALSALRAGAHGFIHAGMHPKEIVYAVRLASEGKRTVPESLLENLVYEEDAEPTLTVLTPRQRQIVEMASEGLTNAQIAERLYLTESTVKQHLYAAYKLLKVRNRIQVAKLVRYEIG